MAVKTCKGSGARGICDDKMMKLLQEGDMVFQRHTKSSWNPAHEVHVVHVKELKALRWNPGLCGVFVRGIDVSPPGPNQVNVRCTTLLALHKYNDEKAFAVVRRHTLQAFVERCKVWVAKRSMQALLFCGHRLGWPELPQESWQEIKIMTFG